MKTRVIFYAMCIFLLTIIQSTVLTSISMYGVKMNLLMVFIVAIALIRGSKEGAWVGFFAGLAQDMTSGKLLFFYALIGLYVGLIIGLTSRKIYRENFLVVVFFTFVTTIIYELVVFIFGIYIFTGNGILYSLGSVIVPETMYNVIVSVFMYIFVIKIEDRLDQQDKGIRKY